MPIYTYNNYILTDGGYVAVTDGLCCGACCTDGDCSNKNKCDCEKNGGTWYAGEDCNNEDFSCDSSSSDSSDSSGSSSYSSSSSYSYSSYSYSSYCEYGACCVRTFNEDSGGDGTGTGYYTYECLDNRTEEECTDYASAEDTRFLSCKTCAEVDCEKAWDSSSSSSSSSSSPKYKSGWVCRPVWVCEPQCQIDEDCPKNCPKEYPVSIQQDGGSLCCPEGAVDVIDGQCVDEDGNNLGLQYEPDPICCGGTCCNGPDIIGCCGNKCLKAGYECCEIGIGGDPPEIDTVIKNPETDQGVCTIDGEQSYKTREECIAAGGEFDLCGCLEVYVWCDPDEAPPAINPGLVGGAGTCVEGATLPVPAPPFGTYCKGYPKHKEKVFGNCSLTCEEVPPAAIRPIMQLAITKSDPYNSDYICDD